MFIRFNHVQMSPCWIKVWTPHWLKVMAAQLWNYGSDLQMTFMTFMTSWLHDLLKGWAFVVQIIVKCCIQRKSFATPWTATMACQGAKMPKATRHRVFTLFQAANIFDASRRSRRESQVFLDSLRCWLLRHPAQDIQTLTSELWNVCFNGFWQGKIRISQAALPIRWKPLRLSPIHNMLWDSAPSGNSGLRCNAWETYRICRLCFQKLPDWEM